MHPSRLRVPVVLCLVFVVAGCSSGGASTSTGPTGASVSVPSASVPSASGPSLPAGSGSVPTGLDAVRTGVPLSEVLPDFPLPPGATSVANRAGPLTQATVKVADVPMAFAFWKDTLPGAGFTVGETTTAGDINSLAFTGHGCLDGSGIVSGQGDVIVDCVLS